VDWDAYHYAQLDYDDETNTDHAQFRQYSNTQGRWLSPDPYRGSYKWRNPQSFNRYAYAGNNPLGFVDTTGLTLCANFCHFNVGGGGGGGNPLDPGSVTPVGPADGSDGNLDALNQAESGGSGGGDSNGFVVIKQPDGSLVPMLILGDSNGFVVIQQPDGSLVPMQVLLDDNGNGTGMYTSNGATTVISFSDFGVSSINIFSENGEFIAISISNSFDGGLSMSIKDVLQNWMYSISQQSSYGKFTVEYGPIFPGMPMGISDAMLGQSLSPFINAARSAGGNNAVKVVHW
jgi:RHS repeat-associated protein